MAINSVFSSSSRLICARHAVVYKTRSSNVPLVARRDSSLLQSSQCGQAAQNPAMTSRMAGKLPTQDLIRSWKLSHRSWNDRHDRRSVVDAPGRPTPANGGYRPKRARDSWQPFERRRQEETGLLEPLFMELHVAGRLMGACCRWAQGRRGWRAETLDCGGTAASPPSTSAGTAGPIRGAIRPSAADA